MTDNEILIQPLSNIVLKSRFEEQKNLYIPLDLLPPEFNDVRNQSALSKVQREQQYKKQFYAKKTIFEEEE